MDGNPPPPPPPPPHGSNPKSSGPSSGLPPGNYDIFIVPPHSAGSGFVYLPSLACERNSFFAGVVATLVAVLVWNIIEPSVKAWFNSVFSGGGASVLIIIALVGAGCWVMGQSSVGGDARPGAGGSGATGNGSAGSWGKSRANGFPGGFGSSPGGSSTGATPRSSWGSAGAGQQRKASASWDKAKEETRQKEEARKDADADAKKKEDADRAARAEAEKQKWEQMRTREREAREREARERLAKERLERDRMEKQKREREDRDNLEREMRARVESEFKAKAEAAAAAARAQAEAEAAEAKKKAEAAKAKQEADAAAAKAKAEADAKAAKEKADKQRADRIKAAKERADRERKEREAKKGQENGTGNKAGSTMNSAPASPTTPKRPYQRPFAKTETDFSGFRPYDDPPTRGRPTARTSTSNYSESVASSSYAPSATTARTSPPRSSYGGPYSTADPTKIVVKGVYMFTSLFPKPTAQLLANTGNVSDGLVLKMTTEGLFIDDDKRHVAERDWDVKAWTLKLVETAELRDVGLYMLRASIRDAEGRRYVFVLSLEESWKVVLGLQKLKKGSQVRALAQTIWNPADALKVLTLCGDQP
ncbi:hypothetical protein BKA81DRAFT_405367 [Phyllosticta paracitricarpa]